jgi:hypothetical protein
VRRWISKGEQSSSTLLPHQEGNVLKERSGGQTFERLRRMAEIVREDAEAISDLILVFSTKAESLIVEVLMKQGWLREDAL